MEEETNFIEIFKILWKKKLIIILVTLAFMVMGGYYRYKSKCLNINQQRLCFWHKTVLQKRKE